ncbi:hypothetical protein C8J57DRAFT_1539409 [Mycena rebaudengoi]|nr:hypothetical protein C8J57DRAFT_1539409 [Mycena rebaudengoi]
MQLHYGSCHIAFGTLSCRLVFAMGTPWGEPTAAVRMSLSFFLVLYSFPRLPSFPSPFQSLLSFLTRVAFLLEHMLSFHHLLSFAFLASSPVDAGSICPDATMAACYRPHFARTESDVGDTSAIESPHFHIIPIVSLSNPARPLPLCTPHFYIFHSHIILCSFETSTIRAHSAADLQQARLY